MKPINEWTLTECVDALRTRVGELTDEEIASVAYRISDIARWIPVTERLPTKEDGDRHGMVLWWTEKEVAGPVMNYWYAHHIFPLHATHWRRNDAPEDV